MPDLVTAPSDIRGRVFQSLERALACQQRGSGIIALEPG
jgi:hypothetical protein